MLGSSYRVNGSVSRGEGRGRKLGFPTANLEGIAQMLPGDGVYGGLAHIEGNQCAVAAIHIGPNPTFDDARKTKVEVHLLDYDGDLYGREVAVDFLMRVREVQKFSGVEELVAQMHQDLQAIRDRIPTSRP